MAPVAGLLRAALRLSGVLPLRVDPAGAVLRQALDRYARRSVVTARSGKLWRARSRLYRNEILQVNMRLKARAESPKCQSGYAGGRTGGGSDLFHPS